MGLGLGLGQEQGRGILAYCMPCWAFRLQIMWELTWDWELNEWILTQRARVGWTLSSSPEVINFPGKRLLRRRWLAAERCDPRDAASCRVATRGYVSPWWLHVMLPIVWVYHRCESSPDLEVHFSFCHQRKFPLSLQRFSSRTRKWMHSV